LAWIALNEVKCPPLKVSMGRGCRMQEGFPEAAVVSVHEEEWGHTVV
jgi:hypothetical protein